MGLGMVSGLRLRLGSTHVEHSSGKRIVKKELSIKLLSKVDKTSSRDLDHHTEIVRLVLWGRVTTAIYEASDTENVSLTHEKYRNDTAIKGRNKTIFFWCYNTHSMPQF